MFQGTTGAGVGGSQGTHPQKLEYCKKTEKDGKKGARDASYMCELEKKCSVPSARVGTGHLCMLWLLFFFCGAQMGQNEIEFNEGAHLRVSRIRDNVATGLK